MPSAEAEIQALLTDSLAALHARDVARHLAQYAPDVRVFDVVDPLQHVGLAALRARVEAWFLGFAGPIECQLQSLTVEVEGDIAFCHSLNHIQATAVTGVKVDMWVRSTVGLRRRAGRWLIVHEHTSTPFNPNTGQASLGLTPEADDRATPPAC